MQVPGAALLITQAPRAPNRDGPRGMILTIVDDSRRMIEIADRLAEMERGLESLRARNDRVLHYLHRELKALTEECRGHRDAWTEVTLRAESLLVTLKRESEAP